MFGFKSKAYRAYEAREKGVFHYAAWLYGDIALSLLKLVGAVVAGIWAYRHRDAIKALFGDLAEALRGFAGQVKMHEKR